MIIAHPPCTYLTTSAEWCYKDDPGKKMKEGVLTGKARREARDRALEFIEAIWNGNSPRICIENPKGVINTRLPWMPKPQWIQPYDFGDDASKLTGLWLKGLPPLEMSTRVPGRIVNYKGKEVERWSNQTDGGWNRLPPSKDRWKLRSYTYPGIAKAIASQWGAS
jgi:hypothetical protein